MIKDNSPTPAPFQIIGSIDGKPVFLRSYANRVILSFNGRNISFRNRDAALLYLQSVCQRAKKGSDDHADKR